MLDLNILLQIFWTALATSAYAVLFAAAFSLVLKVVKVWNFAQAGMMGVAFYAMYFATHQLGLPSVAAVLLGMACTVIVALVLEIYGLQTFRKRNSPPLIFFIFTMIVSEFVQYCLAMLFGTEPVSIAASLIWPSYFVGDIVISQWDIMALCVTLVLIGALYVFLQKTRMGKLMMAAADNPQLSRFYGVNVRQVYALTFVLASVLVCAGMFLFGTRAAMTPSTPMEMMIFAVIASLLGGMGNVFGAAIAAIGLTLVRAFSILVIPSAWQSLILYVLLFITILFFPRGVRLKRKPAKTTGQTQPQQASVQRSDA